MKGNKPSMPPRGGGCRSIELCEDFLIIVWSKMTCMAHSHEHETRATGSGYRIANQMNPKQDMVALTASSRRRLRRLQFAFQSACLTTRARQVATGRLYTSRVANYSRQPGPDVLTSGRCSARQLTAHFVHPKRGMRANGGRRLRRGQDQPWTYCRVTRQWLPLN